MDSVYDRYLKKYEYLIHKQAHYCHKRLPEGYMEYKDIVQEGRIVLMIILRKRLDPKKGQFITLFTKSLKNHYQKIIRGAYRMYRLAVVTTDHKMLEVTPTNPSQHGTLERKERLEYVRSIDEDIADLIEFGVPGPLFILARNKARAKAVKSKRYKTGKIQFTKKLLMTYYGNHINKALMALKD